MDIKRLSSDANSRTGGGDGPSNRAWLISSKVKCGTNESARRSAEGIGAVSRRVTLVKENIMGNALNMTVDRVICFGGRTEWSLRCDARRQS